MTADVTASPAGSRPDATGRFRLVGCRRSRSASVTSLIRYTADDAAVKAAAAISAYPNPLARPRLAPARGAAKTSRCLGHCRGRGAPRVRAPLPGAGGLEHRQQPTGWPGLPGGGVGLASVGRRRSLDRPDWL